MELADIPPLAALMRRHPGWIGAYKRPPPDTGVDAVRLLTWQYLRHREGPAWYGVIDEEGHLRGQAALVPMSQRPEALEVLVWVIPTAGGRGLATAAVTQLCQVGCTERDLTVVHGRAHPENARSLRMLRAAGFSDVPNSDEEPSSEPRPGTEENTRRWVGLTWEPSQPSPATEPGRQ